MIGKLARFIRNLCHLAVAGGFLLLLLAGCVLLRLYIQPYSLNPYMQAIEPWLNVEGYQLRMDELSLVFDGRLHLKGDGIMLENPQGRPLITAHQLDMTFSNKGWLTLQPGLHDARLDGAALELAVYDEAIVFDQFYIPLVHAAEDGVINEADTAASLVTLLNTIKLPPQLAELRQLELSQLLIRAHMYRDRTPEDIAAEVPAPVWRFTNSDVKLELNQGDMKFSVHADLNADDVRTPIFAKVIHKHMADTLSIEVGVDNPKPEVLNPLLPQAIRDMIQAPVSVAVYANLDAENKLQSPRFDLSFAAGQLHLPQVYQQPVPFEQARIEGWYDVTADLLRLNYLGVSHTNGLKIVGSGSFADLKNNIDTNLDVQISEGKMAAVFELIPDQIIPQTIEWLEKTMVEENADIHDLQVLLRGPLKQMPFEGAENLNRLEINAAFKNLSFSPLEKLPAVEASGRMRLVNDTLLVKAENAKMRQQNLHDVSVRVTEMNRQRTTHLNIALQATGPTDDMVAIVTEQMGATPLKNLGGTHKLEGKMDLDLTPDVRFDDAVFDVVASLADLTAEVPYVNLPLVSDVAAIQVTDKTLDFHAHGTLSGQPVNLKWHEKMKDFGNQTEANVRFDPDEKRRKLLAEYGFVTEGALPTVLNLKRIDADTVEFETESDLTAATFGAEHFGWKKAEGEEAKLEARGRVMVDGSSIWVDWLSMRGPQLEILGSAELPMADLSKLTLQLNPFKIADTDAFIDYQDHKLVVMGPSLDLSHWPESDKDEPDPVLEKLDIEAQLQSLKTRQGQVKNLNMKLQRRQSVWTDASITAGLTPKGTLSINLKPTPENNLRLDVVSDNAGAALQVLGIGDHLRNGTLGATLNITDQYGLWEWLASGRVDMGDVQLVRAPLLARILSLLSIQQLFSREEGILFSEVESTFDLNRKQLSLKKLRMSGPSLGLMFKGGIDFADDDMDIEGKLIPAEGINRFVGNIPIIGTLITGSQNALIAADFTVTGKIENPEVDVNPLSVITPGLIKDIFGALFSSDKDRETKKPTSPATVSPPVKQEE